MYTIRVSKFGFHRTYQVTAHTLVEVAGTLRLNLDLVDGTQLSVPHLERKRMKVYPDFWVNQAKQQPPALPREPHPGV